MQIKSRMRHHITPTKLVKQLNLYVTKYQRGYESTETFIHCWMNHKLKHFFTKQIGLT